MWPHYSKNTEKEQAFPLHRCAARLPCHRCSGCTAPLVRRRAREARPAPLFPMQRMHRHTGRSPGAYEHARPALFLFRPAPSHCSTAQRQKGKGIQALRALAFLALPVLLLGVVLAAIWFGGGPVFGSRRSRSSLASRLGAPAPRHVRVVFPRALPPWGFVLWQLSRLPGLRRWRPLVRVLSWLWSPASLRFRLWWSKHVTSRVVCSLCRIALCAVLFLLFLLLGVFFG